MPALVIVFGIIATYSLAGLFGIAIAVTTMLALAGMVVALDAFGPVTDNAGGIAEMADLDPIVRERTDKLDAVGNTTAAIGKGFAIGSAALTSLALFAAFRETVKANTGIELVLDISNPTIMAGLLIGSSLPFVFSALAMQAVGDAAFEMIEEVILNINRTVVQFSETCVRTSTGSAFDFFLKFSALGSGENHIIIAGNRNAS